MPARYYSKLIPIPGDTASKILILFIDTNPLIPEFYSNVEYGPNVKTADSAQQKKWMAKELSNPSRQYKMENCGGASSNVYRRRQNGSV